MCGGLFGGGGGSSYTPPEVQKVNPVATQVTPSNVANQSNVSAELDRQRKRRGYASTQTNSSTLTGDATGANVQGKSTLG